MKPILFYSGDTAELLEEDEGKRKKNEEKFGRGMAYEPTTCDLLIAANGNQVYRLSLDEGRFHEPWSLEGTTGSSSNVAATCISVSQSHPLASVGCDDGVTLHVASVSSEMIGGQNSDFCQERIGLSSLIVC